jgi:hypothetical protein
VEEHGDVGDLGIAQIRERRHTFVGAARADQRADLLAVLVVVDEQRSGEVGTLRRASSIRTMAETAIGHVHRLRALDGGRIERPASTSAAAWRLGRTASTAGRVRWTSSAALRRRAGRRRLCEDPDGHGNRQADREDDDLT